tara:strand:- start:850 stop:1083 length:234 start_codon:yes stop_codon:yes gene_type:complete
MVKQRMGKEITSDPTKSSFSFKIVGDIINELRRVTWPSRQETVRLTIMVLTVAIIVGIFLGIVDAIFSTITGWIMGT